MKPVKTGRGRRRQWSADQKLTVLQEWQTGVPLEELCRKYAPRNAELDTLEREARGVKRGLTRSLSRRAVSHWFERTRLRVSQDEQAGIVVTCRRQNAPGRDVFINCV